MHKLNAAFAALPLACLVPGSATAADLLEAQVDGVVVEDDGPVVVERERIIERRYYPHSYVEVAPPSVEVYERSYRPADYPDRHYWHAGDEW